MAAGNDEGSCHEDPAGCPSSVAEGGQDVMGRASGKGAHTVST